MKVSIGCEPAKTVADLFYRAFRAHGRHAYKDRNRTKLVQGMKEALRLRKATPAQIARYAEMAGVWKKAQPYLEAMTVDA